MQTANAFSNFASQVLGVPSDATLADLRSDYHAHDTDDGIRRNILGQERARRVPRLVEEQVRRVQAQTARERRFYIGNAVARARDRVLRAIATQNRLRLRRREAVEGSRRAGPAQPAARRARQVTRPRARPPDLRSALRRAACRPYA